MSFMRDKAFRSIASPSATIEAKVENKNVPSRALFPVVQIRIGSATKP